MQMAEQFDISTLAWVKGEIDETLKQARVALEQYVDDPGDAGQLQSCIDYIHQVYGTLQMVELGGAALFAEEMEKFCAAIQQDQIENKAQAHELLMRAILQLPDYLESLLAGQGDNPVALVPLLNELRQQRGDKKLDSAAFFRPSLQVIPPPRIGAAAGIDSSVAAKKLHRYYLSALAKVIKGTNVEGGIKGIGKVIDKLLGVAESDNWRRMLWVSSAFVEGLRDNALAVSRESKPLLGKIEQQIKAVAAKGESSLSQEALAKVMRPMLYHLALSEARGDVATSVRQAFALERYLPQGTGGLGGINAELKQTVSADIMDELSSAKDTFDVFVRSDRSSTANLEAMVESLSRLSETLSLLQEDSLRDNLQKQVAVIRQLLAGEVEADDETLMGIAGAILAVESALRDWGSTAPLVKADASEEQVADSDTSPEAIAEHTRVTRQVMKEAKDDLVRIREAINGYLESPEDKSVLEDLPNLLHMIIGSLTLLSYKRVSQVLISCREFIQRELIDADTVPAAERLDALADAVMSVEYYLEAFVQSRVHPGSVLDVAENAVATLGYAVGTGEWPQPTEAEIPRVEGIEVFESAAEAPQPAEEAEAIEAAPVTEAPEVAEVQQPPVEVAVAPPPTPAFEAARKGATVEVDEEIFEIFIEEAEEELQNIQTLLPQWVADPAAVDLLKELRRSFHTLKGSGRLVGASELGEFAWAFENMLNRIIDGTIGHSATIFDMLEQAVEALPELIAQFKDGTEPQSDIALLREMAFEIAQPGEVKATAVPAAPAAPAEEVTELPQATELPDLDPVLLEIYTKESEGHIDALESFVQHIEEGGSRKVTEPLIRALHTLQGSSRMAGVTGIADICATLEKYAKTLHAANETVDADGAAAIAECARYIRAMLAFLADRTNQPLPDGREVQQLASAAYAQVQQLERLAHAHPEAGLAQVAEAGEERWPETPVAEGAEAEAEAEA
ncbi:MAG TPA: Hpt domain-containing protein, partial [Gammaproteobacteria bacterium]